MSTSEFTKYMIAKQFKELLKNHDFHNISVHMIVSNCHISKNTFYYHFQDKYDVIKWIFYSESASIINDLYVHTNWIETLQKLCIYLQENKGFYIKVLHIQEQNSFTECLTEFNFQLTKDMLMHLHADEILATNEIDVVSHFYAYGLTGVISHWAQNGMKVDPRPVIEMLQDTLSGKIYQRLQSYRHEDDKNINK